MERGPLFRYRQALKHQGFFADPAQQRAATALQACFVALQQGSITPGVYLWGPVGFKNKERFIENGCTSIIKSYLLN